MASETVTTSAAWALPGEEGNPVVRRRAAFRGLVLLSLGLLLALVGQIILTRQRNPLDGAVFYLAAVYLFYRAVRHLAPPVALPSLTPYAFKLSRALPALGLGAVAFVLFARERIATTGTFDSAPPQGFTILLVWLAAMLALVVAYWRENLNAEGKIRLESWEKAALLFILLLALLLRLYQLDAIPGNLYLDEGDHGLLGLRLVNYPGYVHYVPDLTGHATLFFYLLGIVIKVAGTDIAIMRLVPVAISMLAVVAVYFLGRELLGPRGALIAAFVMAISRWHITFSRYIFSSSLVPLFMALAVFLLLRALRTRQPLDFIWAGFACAFGLSGYLPIRFVLPAVVAAYLLFKILGRPSFVRIHAAGLSLFVLAFLIAVTPLAIYFARQPDQIFTRAQQASVQQDIARAGSLEPFWANVRKAFGMFNYQGDPRPRHNLPNAPMLDPISGIFFVLGFGYAALRWRRAENSLLIAWVVLGVIPGVLSLADSNPHSLRTISNIPAVCLLTALAAERAWSFVRWRYPANGERGLVAVGAVLAAVALLANVIFYFERQANDKSVYYDYDPVQTEVARRVAELAPSHDVYVAATYTNHSAVKLLDHALPYATFNQTQHLPLRAAGDKDVVYILEPIHRQLLPLFLRYYPAAQVSDWTDRYGMPGFLTITVPRAQVAASQGVSVSYYQGAQRTGTPVLTRQEDVIAADWVAQAPVEPPFSVHWQTALYVGQYGTYVLSIEASGAMSVTLDGQVVLDTTADKRTVALALDGGFHSLEAFAVVPERGGGVALRWRPPTGPEDVIPRSALFKIDVARNGLLGKYYRGNAWAGAPAVRQKDLFIFPNDLLPAPFSIEWEGKIYIPQSGSYVFGTQSDDGSLLYIDEVLVVDNGGHHSDRYVEGRVTLSEGLHDIRLRYFQDDGGRVMELYWTPPGGVKALVPTDVLFPPGTVLTGPIAIATPIPAPPTVLPAVPPVGAPSAVRPSQLAPVMIIGQEGSGPGQFRNPRGIAIDKDGNMYVADTGNKRVQKLSPDGKMVAEWRAAAEPFVEPAGVAIAPNGDIYVLEPEKDGAHRFTPRGEYRGKIGDGLGLYRPRGLTIDASGVLYFANTGGNVVVRVSESGQRLSVIGSAGKRDGQLEQPTDAAVDRQGNIYVADTFNQRVQRFTADGRYVSKWAINPSGTALGPHIAIAADGTVYVTEPDAHQVRAFSPDGALLATWGGQGSAEGQFIQPVGIAVDAAGRVYVVDTGNHRIQVFGSTR